jgi:hypothetical protein
MNKFLVLVALLIGTAGFFTGTVATRTSPFANAYVDAVDGAKVITYGDVLRLSDGKTYRVTHSIVRKSGEPDYIIADMLSLDSKFPYVMVVRSADGKSHGRRYACTAETFKSPEQCKYDPAAAALLEEAIHKVTAPQNLIGNFELLWSWEMEGKEMKEKILAKK